MPLKVNTKRLARAAKQAPRELRQSLRFRFGRIGAEYENRTIDRMGASLRGPFRRNPTKSKLASRTGQLRNSVRHEVRERSGGSDLRVDVSVGNARTKAYVFAQEYGATIRPTRARALTIPMPDNLTTAGVPRFDSPRQVEGLFLFKKGNAAYLARRVGEGIEVLWVLKSQVKIPARLGFEEGWGSRKFDRYRTREINRGIGAALVSVGLK